MKRIPVLILILSAALCPLSAEAIPYKPNFVIFLTDDQRWDTIGNTGVNAEFKQQFGRWIMPEVEERLVKKGVLFTNSFTTTPLCCPDRSCTLSGGFLAHNTGVLTNELPNGGYAKFNDTETLATLLQDAGYKTALIGKYLNGYGQAGPYVPPGWTNFVAISGSDTMVIGSSGRNSSTGRIENISQYFKTYYLKDKSLEFIEESGDSPFLLIFSTTLPHAPAIPAPGDENLFSSYVYRGRAYGEEDLSDKPQWARDEASNFYYIKADEDDMHKNMLRSLQAVDRSVTEIMDKINNTGKLNQTVFIFTSDNGYMWGEHGLFHKGKPYEESIRVPFAILAPGIKPRTDDHLVAVDLDIGKTFFKLAGIEKETDGRSLVPLLENASSSWRSRILIEGFGGRGMFAGLRFSGWKYVEYVSGEKELYDLSSDPYEEQNLANSTQHKDKVDQYSGILGPLKGLAITTETLPYGEPGKSYSFKLEAWGSRTPYAWSIVTGKLPPGLSMNSQSGLISGIPTKEGTFRASIKVKGSSLATHAGRPQEFVKDFNFAIGEIEPVHGPVLTGVTENSAKIWFRVKPAASVQVMYALDPDFDLDFWMSETVATYNSKDYTGAITLTGLEENTTYYYKLIIEGAVEEDLPTFRFKTFPRSAQSARIGILSEFQANASIASPSVAALSTENPDFAILLGGLDNRNPEALNEMRAMHMENRGDEKVAGAALRDHIFYKYPVAYVWNDNDYGPGNSDKTFDQKINTLKAYDEYWPSYSRPNPGEGIWHKFSYGNLVEVFMLDLRSQRDPDTYLDPRFIPDNQTGANREQLRNDPCRSMLDGDECPEGLPKGQKQWLKDGLKNSTARWKIIASTVTWNPTTPCDDAWWDFKAEREELMSFIRDNSIKGVLFISGDIRSGGAIDNGTNAGLPELSVPNANIAGKDVCRTHLPYRDRGCGKWSNGFVEGGSGYGLITLTLDSALMEAKNINESLAPRLNPLTLLTAYRADKNNDGCVDMPELSAFIERWKLSSAEVPIRELIEAMGKFKRGCTPAI